MNTIEILRHAGIWSLLIATHCNKKSIEKKKWVRNQLISVSLLETKLSSRLVACMQENSIDSNKACESEISVEACTKQKEWMNYRKKSANSIIASAFSMQVSLNMRNILKKKFKSNFTQRKRSTNITIERGYFSVETVTGFSINCASQSFVAWTCWLSYLNSLSQHRVIYTHRILKQHMTRSKASKHNKNFNVVTINACAVSRW